MLQTIPTFNTQQYVSVLTYTLTAQLALSADVRCTSPSINI